MKSLTDFVLVHGGAHAGWCWEPMIPHLRENPRVGEVLALDLVGHGSRLKEKPLDEITLEDYVHDIANALQELPNVVLVGHSLAGVSVPQAIARVPEHVKRVVLISATVPPDGQSAMDTMKVMREFGVILGPSTGEEFEEWARRSFCSDMDESTSRWVIKSLGPEPRLPLATPVSYIDLPTNIPLTYIVLTADQVLTAELQRWMSRNLDCAEVVEMEAGHDAMVSRPRELASVLLEYV
ncbi:alpha/beta fold hydrolase [Chloroflexota bacterium]